MKVAIIGAGISGLACAHELEKYGINTTIFERNSFIGEAFEHVGAVLEIAFRPVKDANKYMNEVLGIDIKPIHTVDKIVHISPNKITPIKGKLGYMYERSRRTSDVKVQMYKLLKQSKVEFSSYVDYQALSREYDKVVIANGYPNFTNELGCWLEWVNTNVRGATVLGNFEPGTLIVWVNREYCANGYAYLTPFDEHRASLILVATDSNEKDIDHYWELFLYSENIRYTIIEEFKLSHKSGNVYPHKTGNIYFAGNAGGAIEPFLGFGVTSSFITGVMAARAIALDKDYEKLIKEVVDRNFQLYKMRKAFNGLTNSGYDMLFTMIGAPVVKQLAYYTPLNVIKLSAGFLGLKQKLTQPNK